MCERIWLEFCKIKWPTLVIGSEEYNARRKAFFVGMFSMIGFVSKTPEHALAELINRVHTELKTELKRGESEVIVNKSIKLN